MKRNKRENEELQVRQLLRLLGMTSNPIPQPDGKGADYAIDLAGLAAYGKGPIPDPPNGAIGPQDPVLFIVSTEHALREAGKHSAAVIGMDHVEKCSRMTINIVRGTE